MFYHTSVEQIPGTFKTMEYVCIYARTYTEVTMKKLVSRKKNRSSLWPGLPFVLLYYWHEFWLVLPSPFLKLFFFLTSMYKQQRKCKKKRALPYIYAKLRLWSHTWKKTMGFQLFHWMLRTPIYMSQVMQKREPLPSRYHKYQELKNLDFIWNDYLSKTLLGTMGKNKSSRWHCPYPQGA